MSRSFSLLAASPDRYRVAAAAFAEPVPAEGWLREVFARNDTEFSRFWRSGYADKLEDEALRPEVLRDAFVALIGDGEPIELPLSRLLPVVAQGSPEVAPLGKLFARPVFDVELPECLRAAARGRLGVWSSAPLTAPLERVRPFATREGVEAYYADRSYTFPEISGGVPERERALAREWLGDGLWPAWEELLAVLERVVSADAHLALVTRG